MLPRFNHILLPVDVAHRNKTALDIAFELAVENKARVTLLHVIQAIDSEGEEPDRETKAFYEHLQQRMESDMDGMAQRFRDADVDVAVKVHVGDRLGEITSFAGTHGADLIVMTSHRVDPNDLAATWGTLSYKVSVVCDCPILLVK
jgi:universal stress protein A